MNSNNMPLPLELTKPVLLAGDLDTQFRTGLAVGEYDPKTQLCGGGDRGHGGSRSSQQSNSCSGLLVIDVTLDLQIDDNSF